MPELPEVETVRNTLKNYILNEKIVKVNIYYDGIIKTDINEFQTKLINESIKDILRYGKYLIFIFDNVSIISHLRMEGKFYIKKINDSLVTHEHVEFVFESGKVLRYHDTRKFGTMHLVNSTNIKDLMNTKELSILGPEANTDFDYYDLYNKLHKRHDPIKVSLLDQSLLCGLGNIYVDEVLYECGIHPLTKSNNLTIYDCYKIKVSANNILSLAIKDGGTTIRSYTSSLGVTGRFQQHLHVHTLDGQKCKICGNIIEKIRVGGRGTYFCPSCQKILPKVYGITGVISSGKSTVSKYFIDKGYEVYDADEIVHSLYKQDDVKEELIKMFGNSIIKDNEISRKVLGNIVFNNNELLKKLESFIHPLVKKEIVKLIKNTSNDKIFFEVQLLFESGINNYCSDIIFVNCCEDELIKRLIKRNNISLDAAAKLLSLYNKEDISKKINHSHVIIDNSKELCYTFNQLEKIK